jgi:hypothetical protein
MLIGLRSARVAAAMAAQRFSDADLKERWTLLRSSMVSALTGADKTSSFTPRRGS